MTTTTDLSRVFAEFAAGASYEQLSASAVEAAKQSILDTYGVILAASGMEPAARLAVDFAKESGGTPESTVFAFGGRLPAFMAAFANGAMAHALDFDDQTPWGQHSASSLIPAVLAVGERQGHVSGKEMITAVAVGQDLFNRLRRHIEWKKDWFFTTAIGVFCATAAVGRLLQLSSDEIANALGIASLQSAGTCEMLGATEGDLRAIYAGFPAKGAVMAALLAEKGLRGISTLFEGNNGILQLCFGGRCARESIVERLGKEFTGDRTLYKRWPAVGTAHSHLHATIGLVKEHSLRAADIDEIKIFVGDFHQLMSHPLEARRAPATLADAKFSLPYLVAVGATNGELKLADFTMTALRSPEVLATARKVNPVPDSAADWRFDLPPGRVEIVMRDGRKFERVGVGIPGSVENPLSWQDLFEKFEECASVSVSPLSAGSAHQIQQFVKNLEDADNACDFLRLGDVPVAASA